MSNVSVVSLVSILASAPARAPFAGAPWILPVRMFLAPLLIGAATLIARRWGPEAGGWFAALPLTSGPVVFVLALEHGALFAAESCIGIVLAIVALVAYVLVYCRASRRLGWRASGALACLAYLLCLWPLGRVRVPLAIAFLLACATVFATRLLLPHETGPRATLRRPVSELPLRMAIAATLVWVLAQLSAAVGPFVSGLLAPLPVAVTIMSTFTHRDDGSAAARQFLRSFLTGLPSFAVFFAVAGALLPTRAMATGFVAGALGALATHAVMWRVTGRAPALIPIPLERT